MKAKHNFLVKQLLIALFIILHSFSQAQNAFPAGTFQRGYGTAGDDEANAVCKTSDKGWAAAGYSNGFGTGNDFFIVKFDSNGVVKWSAHLNALGIESATGIKEANNGDLLVVGNTKVSNLSNSYTDVLLARYTANGTFLWQQIISNTSTSNDEAYEILALPNGNIFIAGSTNSTGIAGEAAIWITDAVGTVLSTKIYNRTGKEYFSDCELSYDGNILACSPSTNGTIDIIWLFKLNYNGDTLWTKHYDYNYNYIHVNAITELLSKQIVLVGTERPGFGNSNAFIHRVDSLGKFISHSAGLTLQTQLFDVAASKTPIPNEDDLFLMTGTYNSYQNRFGIASQDTNGLSVFWRFLDPSTYSTFNYSIPDFNPTTNAIVTDIYDNIYIGSCIVGSTRLSGYGGLDFAIARSDFQETGANYQQPCITSASTTICAGDSVKLSVSCNPKLSQRWMKLSGTANYKLGSDTIYYANQAGIYCLAAYNVDSTMWLSNIVIIDVLDTAKPVVSKSGATSFCGASGQSVNLSIPASLFATFQWYKDSVAIVGATGRTYSATSTGNYYCIRTNTCATVYSNSVAVNANLAPTHFTFGSGFPFGNVDIIYPWCQSGAYNTALNANSNPTYSYAWYLTTSFGGTQLISNTISCLPQDTGYLICITSNGCGIDTSDLIHVMDLGPPSPGPYQSGIYPPHPIIEYVCQGFSIQLSAPYLAQGIYSGPYTWYWNGSPVSTDSIYTATQPGTYSISFMEPACSPFPIMSKEVTFQYYQPVLPSSMTITGSLLTACQMPQYLYAQIFPGFTNWDYAWAKVGSTFSFGGDTLQLQAWMGSGDYYCTLSNGICPNKLNSNIIHIDFAYSNLNYSAPPSLCTSPGGVTFSIKTPIAGSTYQWYKDTTLNYYNGVAIAGATASSYLATQFASYYCEVTLNGCNVNSQQVLLSSANPSLTFGFTQQPICGLCNGSLSLNVTPGISTPQWENGSYAWSRNNLCPGTYIAHSADAGGCVVADTIILTTQNNIVISQSNAVVPSPGNCDGQVTVQATGGAPPYLYVYNPIPPASGYCDSTIYTITVTDGNGCVNTDTLFFVPDGLVWPGDANYDLVANNFDLFPIGMAYGDTGPVRNNASILWQAQAANDWIDSINFVNNKHVDCNGDGLIDVQDTLAISNNYGLHHLRGNGVEETNVLSPQLYFATTIDTAQAGDHILIHLKLGTAQLPVDSIYGIAFTINYSKPVVDSASVFAKFDSCWIGTINSNLISIQKDDYANGKLDLAIVRTDKLNQGGHGTIGVLSADMKDDLSGRADIYKMLNLTFNNIKAILFDGSEILLNPLNDSIVVHDEITNNTALAQMQNSIQLAPNPAFNATTINLGKAKGFASELLVYSTLGEVMYKMKIQNESKLLLNTQNYSAGIYFIQIKTKEGILIKKLSVRK